MTEGVTEGDTEGETEIKAEGRERDRERERDSRLDGDAALALDLEPVHDLLVVGVLLDRPGDLQ